MTLGDVVVGVVLAAYGAWLGLGGLERLGRRLSVWPGKFAPARQRFWEAFVRASGVGFVLVGILIAFE